MKRVILYLMILGSLMTGCGPARKSVKSVPPEEEKFAEDFQTVSEYPVSRDMTYLLYLDSLSDEEVLTPTPATPVPEMSIDDAMGMLGVKTDWPVDYLCPDMPPYTSGKINGWNSSGEGEYDLFILIKNTSQKDLDNYIQELIDNGFYENNGSYVKDQFTVSFQFNSDTVLQISSYRLETIEWPEILDFMPPLTEGYLTSMNSPTEETPYGNLDFTGLTIEGIRKWETQLLQAGFTIESESYSMENVSFMGNKYTFSAFFEGNGTNEWILYFALE